MLHVTFSSSAAGMLRQVLGDRRDRAKVIDLNDDLDWGPIAVESLDERGAWFDHNSPLGFRDRDDAGLLPEFAKWDWLASGELRFRNAVSADPDRIIWIAPNSAAEQAGLYWYLDQFGGVGTKMIIADYPLRGAWEGEIPPRLGALDEAQITELLDESPRIFWDASRFPADRWRQLITENALLRVLKDGDLQSVPEDFFDHHLLARCPENWTKSHRVIADAMIASWDDGRDPNVYLLTWRLRDLIGRGQIDCDGELPTGIASGQYAGIRLIR